MVLMINAFLMMDNALLGTKMMEQERNVLTSPKTVLMATSMMVED